MVARDAPLKQLLSRATSGNRRAASQLMSLVENDPAARFRILSALYWKSGKAHIIGITGPPGCGKSSLIARLAKNYSAKNEKVGIVAVDPSSQISGGALLGDRIRMTELSSDPRVFIRSMATRGYFGGVARATEDVVRILGAILMTRVIIETAGAGQSDVDIRKLADTTVVVTAPDFGDEIQALKAGIMEIGDIFVVNKADKENADRTVREIRNMIMMSESEGWRPHVLKTNALSGEGIISLVETIRLHSEYQVRETSKLDTSDRAKREIIYAMKRYFEDITLQKAISSKWFEGLLVEVTERKLDPYKAARKTLRKSLALT